MMNRRAFLLAGGAAALSAAPPRRPNILFILADDMGWADLGPYGNTFHETPHTDKLARDGVRFTNAYAACPVCSPTRASIMTGKYPAHVNITDWIPGRKQWPSAKLLTPEFNQQLPLSETTIAEALKPLGYRTGAIGKWHLGGDGFHPENQGFDVNIGGNHRGSPRSFFGPYSFPNLDGKEGEYLTDRITAEAQSFIRESAGKNPFFLYLAHYTVHIPLQAPPALVEKYQKKLNGRDLPNPTYAAMMETFDNSIGEIRKTLDECGVAKDTIIIVTSDNGGLRYEGKSKKLVTQNKPFRAGKGHLYEGGIREPLLIYWPGVTQPGVVVDTQVSSVDYLPTIVDMAGGRAPRVDGVSITPVLRGKSLPERPLFWHYPHYSNQGGVPGGAIRIGDWKLIEFYEDNRLELFNLKVDPGETRNLAALEPKRAAAMRARLDKWRKQVDARMPRVNPDYNPATADQGLTGAERPTPPDSR